MHIIILGAAAGGGLPQWNCGCRNCDAARAGRIPSLTQSSIAVSADVTRRAGVYNDGGKGLGVTCGDYDNDGGQDLLLPTTAILTVCSVIGEMVYLRKSRLCSLSLATTIWETKEAGMGTALGDYNNDGLHLTASNFQN